MPERILDREEIRLAMLYLARMYLSYDGKPYSGPLRVSVAKPEEREVKAFRPKGTTDGMVPPCWFALGVQCELGVDVSEVLRVLLSPDEEKLVRDLVSHQPCSATSVQERCKAVMSKTDFWAAWGQLQGRELVEQGDDDRYRVGPEWLAEWLKAKS